MKEKQHECVVCRKAKNCITMIGPIYGPKRKKDMFVYSENHCGWICLKCLKASEKTVRLPLFELDRNSSYSKRGDYEVP